MPFSAIIYLNGYELSVESSPHLASAIQDLFLDSPSIMPPVSEKPKKDVTNDIMSLFVYVNALHYLFEWV